MEPKSDIALDTKNAVEDVESEMKIKITNPVWRNIIIFMAIIFVLFHVYTTIFGIFPALIQRSIHLGFALVLCFAIMPMNRTETNKKTVPWYDAILILFSILTTGYIPLIYDEIIRNPLIWLSPFDMIFAAILLLLILEAGRRTVGWTFPILVLLVVIYSIFGPYFPGLWGHSGFSFSVILQTLYHSSNGIWGLMLGISSTILAIFAIFGATLIAIGAGESFLMISQLLTKGSRGGAAKVSIFSSGMFGMVSGSAVSNVVTTGNFTIPAMKKNGFSSPFAGAVEAVASTGGQIIPPVLGAGAFIMAQTLGIAYSEIAIAAIIPALLFYWGAFISVDLESRKLGIQAIRTEDFKKFSFTKILLFLIPLSVFIYFLFSGYTPSLGGVWAIVTGIALFIILRPKEKRNKKSVVKMSTGISIATARTILQIAALLACAQIVISLISMTGLGVKLSSFIIGFANESLFLALILTAVVCIFLGMGLPTTAAYVIAASVLGPALIGIGVAPLIAHLFIFYFAVLSTITPPVCAAVFLAAALADTNWWKTAVEAMKLGVTAFVVPFAFVYSESLLLMGPINERILASVTAIIGVFLLAIATIGYFKINVNPFIRIISATAGILLIVPNIIFSLLGLVLGLFVLTIQIKAKKKYFESKQSNLGTEL